MGIALHPDFATDRFFFVYYSARRGDDTANRVERYRLAEDAASATPDRVILDGIPAAQNHDGGRLRFGPDGMLYIGTGDASEPDDAQNAQNLAGKLLRLTPDGEVPPDNPPPAGHGRLREVLMGPDRQLYVTPSNCDGRGTCPPDRDRILRVTR